jgi:Na+/melibiose symporter-like transporter
MISSTDAGEEAAEGSRDTPERGLRRGERRFLALLGLPTFGLALSITTVTTYLPVVARRFVGSTVIIGVIVGIEGLMALWVPIVAGTWSDRLRSRWGGRLPFLAAGTPVVAVALLAMGAVRSVGLLALVAGCFFAAYFVAYEPYRALYPDAVDDAIAGRAQSTQALFRGLGTGVALLGGGLLISLAEPAPFIAAAIIVVGAIATFTVVYVRRGVKEHDRRAHTSLPDEARRLRDLLRDHPALRTFLLANGLWELSLGALKTFVFLYLTIGLGLKPAQGALAIGAAAGFVLAGAAGSGKLGDRYGRTTVLKFALPLYGIGLLIPFVFTNMFVVAASVPVFALGGGAIMALPYAVLTPLMPEKDHGTLTGFYTFSRGLGTALGPLLAGLAITVGRSSFPASHGFQATWGVCALAILASIPFLGRLRRQEREACTD